MFDKILQINLLFDFYGQLLTDKQQDVLQFYYTHDLSLGEISEQLNVTRQAVYDTMKRAEKILFEYEEKLGLVGKFNNTKVQIQEIIKISENIENNIDLFVSNPEEMLSDIRRIKEISCDILEK